MHTPKTPHTMRFAPDIWPRVQEIARIMRERDGRDASATEAVERAVREYHEQIKREVKQAN